jgi:hypothetical protein
MRNPTHYSNPVPQAPAPTVPISCAVDNAEVLAFIRAGSDILRAIAGAVQHRYEDMAVEATHHLAAPSRRPEVLFLPPRRGPRTAPFDI